MKNNIFFFIVLFLIGPQCCTSTEVLHKHENVELKFVSLPSVQDLNDIRTALTDKEQQICSLVEDKVYRCTADTPCAPIQNATNIKNFMLLYTDAIMTPVVKFNNIYYGSTGMDIFKINFKNFFADYNLQNYAENNDTFSFLYIVGKQLKSHSQLHNGTKILCTLSDTQIFLQNEIRLSVLKTKKHLKVGFAIL